MAGLFLIYLLCLLVEPSLLSSVLVRTSYLISEYCDGLTHFSVLIHTFVIEHYYYSCHITSANSKITWKGGDKQYSPPKNFKIPNFSYEYRDVRVMAEICQSITTAKPEVTQFKLKSPGKPQGH